MKRILPITAGLSLMLMAGCATDRDATVNEPAGAQSMTNAAPDTPARDINQRPYPGVDPSVDVDRGYRINPP